MPSWSRCGARTCGWKSRSTPTFCFRAARARSRAAAEPVLDKLAEVLEALSQSDPRRRTYRRSADSHRAHFPPIGSCRRRAPRASCINSPSRASIRCGSRSSASANFIRASRMTTTRGATRIAASPFWCWRRCRRAMPRRQNPPPYTPEATPSGVETADAGSATDRLLYRVPPAALDNTVLVKPKPGGQVAP